MCCTDWIYWTGFLLTGWQPWTYFTIQFWISDLELITGPFGCVGSQCGLPALGILGLSHTKLFVCYLLDQHILLLLIPVWLCACVCVCVSCSSGRAPRAQTVDLLERYGYSESNPIPSFHALNATVPGAAACWCDTVRLFGSQKVKYDVRLFYYSSRWTIMFYSLVFYRISTLLYSISILFCF